MKYFLLPLKITFISIFVLSSLLAEAQQHSIARDWNEALLFSISADFARPTVHARNLFHSSVLMHDAWAAYDPQAKAYFLGQTIGDFSCPFSGVPTPDDLQAAREEAISFAMYRLIEHRYAESPGIVPISNTIDSIMVAHGYNASNTSTSYTTGGSAELGNYLAEQLIAFGYQDGANEANNYANQYYEPVNPPIEVEETGNPEMNDPNRWQQIQLSLSIDQSGEIVDSAPDFLSPEWGNVIPFAMTDENLTVKTRDGNDYLLYYDPGDPAYIDTTTALGLESDYKWNFMMVPIWQAQHDTSDGVIWDISPASQGNIQSYPTNQAEMESFYDYFDGGDPGEGYDVNPITGEPYEPQMVPRADYTRVLAEFWADGPQSVTPPGHWFDIYNDVSDHPLFERKWMGEGDELDTLEYDVKAYFAIGGAMHDVAISAWGIKGYYDYPRPVSAVRFMADKGQCTNNSLDNYHPAGVPLVPGYVEVVESGDELAGDANENVGKIKLYTWRGPDYIEDPDTDEAGVGWILAENWWPYQRPSFVSPPFAGYISGHSTYSRAAAEVLTLMTGSPFFPGGMSEYSFDANEFLVFEQGPSQTIELQWATYRDASDQCSLSRIWGGIHPPIDDIPGRFIGMEIGPQAFYLANEIVSASVPFVSDFSSSVQIMNENSVGDLITLAFVFDQPMNTAITPQVAFFGNEPTVDALVLQSDEWVNVNTFEVVYQLTNGEFEYPNISVGISGAESNTALPANPYIAPEAFSIDTKKPAVSTVTSSDVLVNDAVADAGMVFFEIVFDEACDTLSSPSIAFNASGELGNSLSWSEENSHWLSENSFLAFFEVIDENIGVSSVGVEISNVADIAQNQLDLHLENSVFSIDTKNPEANSLLANSSAFNQNDAGNSAIVFNLSFNEPMNTNIDPELAFPNDNILANSANYNPFNSSWTSDTECVIAYDLLNANETFFSIGISLELFEDTAGNTAVEDLMLDLFSIDTQKPEVVGIDPNTTLVSDLNVGGAGLELDIHFSEAMDIEQIPLLTMESDDPVASSLAYQIISSEWINSSTFKGIFSVSDQNVEIEGIGVGVSFARDSLGNVQTPSTTDSVLSLDTKNPVITLVEPSITDITNDLLGEGTMDIVVHFDEPMATEPLPVFNFTPAIPINTVLVANDALSVWLDETTHHRFFDVLGFPADEPLVNAEISASRDMAGNLVEPITLFEFFSVFIDPQSQKEESGNTDFVLFPSPVASGGILSIATNVQLSKAQLSIVNVNGVLSHQEFLNGDGSGTFQLALPDLASGMYFLQIRGDQMVATEKFLVSK